MEMARLTSYGWLLLALVVMMSQVEKSVTQSGTYRSCYQGYCFTAAAAESNGDSNDFLKNQSRAVNWCSNLGLTLVTLDSAQKHAALLQFILDHEYTSDSVWIAAEIPNNVTQWTWNNGSTYSGNGLSVAAGDVTPAAAFYSISNRNVMRGSHSDTRSYICQFQGASLCSALSANYSAPGGHSSQIRKVVLPLSQDSCFIGFPVDSSRATKRWHEARLTCQFHGGDLLADIDRVPWSNALTIFGGLEFWIGLQYNPVMAFTTTGPGQKNYYVSKYNPFSRSNPMPSPTSTSGPFCMALSFDARYDVFVSYSCVTPLLAICDSPVTGDGPNMATTTAMTTATSTAPVYYVGSVSAAAFGGILAGCIAFYLISIIIAVLISCFCRCHRCRPIDERRQRKPDMGQRRPSSDDEKTGQKRRHGNFEENLYNDTPAPTGVQDDVRGHGQVHNAAYDHDPDGGWGNGGGYQYGDDGYDDDDDDAGRTERIYADTTGQSPNSLAAARY